MARTIEQILVEQLGTLSFNIAGLQAAIEQLRDQNAKLQEQLASVAAADEQRTTSRN